MKTSAPYQLDYVGARTMSALEMLSCQTLGISPNEDPSTSSSLSSSPASSTTSVAESTSSPSPSSDAAFDDGTSLHSPATSMPFDEANPEPDFDFDMKPKAVVFDFDNTLVDTRGADIHAYSQVKSILQQYLPGIGEDASNQILIQFKDLINKYPVDPMWSTGVDDWRIMLWSKAVSEVLAPETIPPSSVALIYHYWKSQRLDYLALDEDVEAMLRRLRHEYTLVLITNGHSCIQWEKLERTGVRDLFDCVIVSGDYDCKKPDAEIFRYASEQIGVSLEEMVMIGDNLSTDIKGGFNAGMLATVWVTTHLMQSGGSISPTETSTSAIVARPSASSGDAGSNATLPRSAASARGLEPSARDNNSSCDAEEESRSRALDPSQSKISQETTSFSPSYGAGLPPAVAAALLAQATAQTSSYSFDYGDSDIFEPTYTISSVLEVPKVLHSIALCL